VTQLSNCAHCLFSFNLNYYINLDISVAANIEVNPNGSGLAAAQEEETEAVSSTHSEADDDIVYPETPSVIRPIRPVFLPEYRIEEHMKKLDVENLLVLKSNVCCKYNKRQ